MLKSLIKIPYDSRPYKSDARPGHWPTEQERLAFPVAEVPEPLEGSDQALHVAATVAFTDGGALVHHFLQNRQQPIRYVQFSGVAGLMKGDGNLVGQTAGVS